jgi:hypothetical protein
VRSRERERARGRERERERERGKEREREEEGEGKRERERERKNPERNIPLTIASLWRRFGKRCHIIQRITVWYNFSFSYR